MISKRFVKTSFLYTVAGALPMASAVILLPFYQLFISPADFGVLSIFLAFSAFVQMLVTFGFDSSIFIHYHDFKNDKPGLAVFTSSMFIFIMLTGIAVGLLFTLLGDLVFKIIFTGKPISFFPYGVLSIITGILQAISRVYVSFLQTSQRSVHFFSANLISFTLIAALSIAGLYVFPDSLVGPVAGRALAAIVTATWTAFMVFGEFGVHFNYRGLRESFGFNRPTLIYQIQQWSINYLDRFLMIFFFPLSQIGVYDFAVKCMMAIDFVIGGLYNSFYPKVISVISAQEKKTSTPEINRYYYGLIAAIMLLVCSAVLFFEFIIDMGWIKKGFQASLPFFSLVGIVYLIRGARYYFVAPYGVLKYTRPLPLIYLFISVIKITALLVFIKPFDIYGVVLSTMFSSVIEIILLRKVISSRFQYNFNPYKLVLAPLLLALVMGASALLGEEGKYWNFFIYPTFCLGMLLWVYRREIKVIKPSTFFR